jgi:paraquat-inducible protein A
LVQYSTSLPKDGVAPADQIDQQVACHECDALLDLKPLTKGQRAQCPRCGGLIQIARDDHLTRALAFAIAGLLLLPIANAYPFLGFERSGLENMFRLPQAAEILFNNDAHTLSFIVLGLVVILPAVLLALVLSLVIPLIRGRDAPWLVPAGRLLYGMNPWNMVEVFVIGVIVSLVKIMKLATVVIGISFWAYIGFAICLIGAISHLDRLSVWQAIDRVSNR